MLDHVGFAVHDYERSKPLYEKALAPLGFTLIMEPAGEAAGFGNGEGRPSFWLEAQGEAIQGGLHIALTASTRPKWTHLTQQPSAPAAPTTARLGFARCTTPDYYGAYVLDPDS